jgi:AAA domain
MNPSPQPSKVVLPSPAQKAAFDKLTVSMDDVKTTTLSAPPRILVMGSEAIGKTTLAASAPRSIGVMAKGEDGVPALVSAGRLPPDTPYFPMCLLWETLLDVVRALLVLTHNYKLVYFDTLNTIEVLLHEYVCRTQFDGDMSKSGFLSYNAGYEIALDPLRQFLALLDRLRVERQMAVVFLAHTRIRTYKNPEGADYDRFVPDVHEKTWGVVHRWLDVVLFYNFETVVTEVVKTGPGKKGKGQGGTHRVIRTERTAAYDAKNRLGLPAVIDMGSRPQDSWGNLMGAFRQARENPLFPKAEATRGEEQLEEKTEEKREEVTTS